MRAGDMDRRITILRLSNTGDDGYGNFFQVWTNHATVWAEVKQSNGKEFLAAGRIGDERKMTVRIRFLEGINTIDRLSYQGCEYDIVEVRELGRMRGLEIHAFKRA